MTIPEAPFRRVLIANRGEIAVRIIRACHELGIEAVAVYSDADAEAAHVRLADLAVRLGPPPPSESYLRIDAVIDAARATGSEAIHPGYGFLAERAAFARAAEDAGIVFVGPRSATIEALGDKLNARRLAARVGVPSVPGTLEPAPVDRPDQVASIVETARTIGFPLLVKAAAGGGGRGMRRVAREEDLAAALVSGSREALSAFGDGSVYLEREILPARHIEVQLLADAHGRVVALGERDCSLQRRHQKLVEEAPAPGLTGEQRRHLHGLAIRLGEAAELRNAATCEFLHDPAGNSWFLEVNTRLQVEHGVTELVTGIDIVREQLRIAAGTPLSEEVVAAGERAATPEGHAIEVRIAAEDPARSFAPTPGRVGRWVMPAGPGVRVDTHIEAGDRVPADYDNLIAKLMVHANDRDAAIDRLRRALDETEIGGVQTTLPFHRAVARSDAFRRADLSTGWVGLNWDGDAARRAAIGKALLATGLVAVEEDGGEPDGVAPHPGTTGGPLAVAAGAPPAPPARNGWRGGGRGRGVDRWPG
ncbi:MAG TPA: biotin carboxylase N-terminal domain-containing protein [Candidatus Limnocylindrales bacterium]|nr:biotin carboxylase N-terminal domain-containing protein [Candidatus Limnocylindrales bacterium]